MSDKFLKVKDNGAEGLALVRAEAGDVAEELGVDDLKTQIDEISEEVEQAIPTADASATNSGVTCEVQSDGSLKVYGTATATRTYLYINGQNMFAVNSTTFRKMLDAGFYDMELQVSGAYEGNVPFYYTYTTFADGVVAVSRLNPTAKINFAAPVMIGVRIVNGMNYGTSDNPTYIRFSATKLNAVDQQARESIDDITDILKQYNAVNLLDEFCEFDNETSNGITFTWNEDKTVCTVTGTSTATASNTLYRNVSALPDAIKPGEKYQVKVESTDINNKLAILTYLGGSTTEYDAQYFPSDGVYSVPANATGLVVRIQISSGRTVNGTISFAVMNAYSNKTLSENVDALNANNGIANANAKLRSFGNSILTGSVNTIHDGESTARFDHLSAYDNAPYARIARALGIPQRNVSHTLMDSTGLIHDAGEGSFLETIKETDLSGYDYLLTQFWSSDLNDAGIGTLDDTAENETLAGAVVDLVNYMKTSNGLCQLILISVPPVSYNYTGRSVFTHVYDGGNNVLELDELMHKMAEKYRFIYIDWQNLNLSYYYQDYTSGYNVHANNEETYRAMGDYLAANLRYAQSDISNRFDAEETFGTDVLRENGKFQTGSHSGITFTWNADGTVCTVSGMATARANHNIYSQQKYLPKGIFPGDDMIVRFHASSTDVYPRSIFWASGDVEISNTPMTMDIPIRVPENAIGWTLRLNVESGKDLTGDKAVRVDRIQAIKLHPRRMDVPLIVSFVDDDTSADQYVTRYHDNCCHNGVAGNYAVITKHIEDGDTTLSTMLDYQDDGFGMLLHCYEQVPTGDNYWTASPRTKAQTNQCRANLIKGMNYLRENGFVNYRHWITPGGHREDDLVAVAKEIGLFNLISTQNGRENTPQDCNKWFIKRVSLKHDDTSASMTMAKVKEYIDTAVAHGCGWLIIVTHFNEGWKNLTGADAWDSTLDANGYPVGYPRFNEMVQYALSKGMVPMTVPEAWAYYGPVLEANYAECTEGNA